MTKRYCPIDTVEFPAELTDAVRESTCDFGKDSDIRAFRNSRLYFELVDAWSSQPILPLDDGDDYDGEPEIALTRPSWPPKAPPLTSGAAEALHTRATVVIRSAQQSSREALVLVPAPEACYDLA